ncbi:hypothetical protein FD723_41580 (plasmid) [Nostoc sp. C052]|uniref:hypothetical protein n=1 Tax=Nostoc sp. C052 TaxID=2576902 RepID=UPI0015C36CD8|nr:hypothetical protein [Nostoc sp. C052]QLE46681.1 hypothetical protein FD723_41580 [Nostoc sp. C052]
MLLWGQLEKSKQPDIDELSNTPDFELITPREFFNHTNKANWLYRRRYTPDIVVNHLILNFHLPKIIRNCG